MRRTERSTLTREHGAALLIMVALLLLGVASAGFVFVGPTIESSLREDRTSEVLASVKQALIGYASQRGELQTCGSLSVAANVAPCAAALRARPGELPCPDMDNDGIAEDKCDDPSKRLGRVPWKTLGIPDPRDNAGETLWYAVAFPFLGTASNPVVVNVSGVITGGVINSSTVGNLEVRAEAAGGSYVQVTTQAVAVLFSPGPAVSGQNRGSTSVTCGTVSLPRNRCAANYLETAAGTNNSLSGGPYILGKASATYNDRLLYITANDIMPVVEMRVGQELKRLLLGYRNNSECRCYPWADSWDYSGGIADVGVNRGRFPSTAYPVNWGTVDATNNIPPLPSWIPMNDWHNLVFYAAARQETDGFGTRCYFCGDSATLTVRLDNTANGPTQNASALVLTPGSPRPGVPRPGTPFDMNANQTRANAMSGYFEDALNTNKGPCPDCPGGVACAGWDAENANDAADAKAHGQTAAPACDVYVRPQSRAYDRDRMYTIVTQSASQCAIAAQALIAAAPCKIATVGVCTSLVASLTTCTCKLAAAAMLQVPCYNTLTPSPHCDAPIAELKVCVQ